jgi:hypothetical protein
MARGFQKGHIAWNKGSNVSKTTKDKISKANKGRVFSSEIKKRWSDQRVGQRIGSNNPAWKGGVTPERVKIRTSIEYELWRKAVFARDMFTCQKTKISGGRLTAHHINNFAEFPELRFAIDNGITLREDVHKEFHKRYGRKNNCRQQLEEFLAN